MSNKKIEEMRKAMGTHPSARPKKETKLVRGCEQLEVDIIDHSSNPYKAIVNAATATWGNDNYEDKWTKMSAENRYRVVLAALTGNTLPQALESIKFSFRVRGVPRHCFDQHARARIGSTFFSIGSRDNNKLDSSIVLYTKLYDKIHKKDFKDVLDHMYKIKDMYEKIIKDGQGSWQIARAVLPMSYHHPYCFSQDFLALQRQCSRRMMFCEEEFIVGLHWMLKKEIGKKFPLLANYLRPACDKAKKCVYSKSYKLSNVFGCLFAGCGRWPSKTEYATFNESCTDKDELEKQLGFKIESKNDWMDYTEDDYDDISDKDKKYLEAE